MSDLEKAPATPGVNRWRHRSIGPCPECGELFPTLQRYIYIKGAWIVRCDKCFCRSVTKMTPKEAVIAWNARTLTHISLMYIQMNEERKRGRHDDRDEDEPGGMGEEVRDPDAGSKRGSGRRVHRKKHA